MCGITGTIGWADEKMIQRMTAALDHRGPDADGVRLWPDMPAAFGHRRLAIIDLTDAGRQPLCTRDGRYWITFNGEIYNYRELRAQLVDKGVAFSSHTDTEVVAAAYGIWGTACLQRFRGMFAFAIVDTAEQTVFLARDRFGIKPLYYTRTRDGLAFASEIRAFTAAAVVSPRADRQAIWDYLSLGSVAQPRTILHGVRMLEPGHWMKVDRRGKTREKACYWDLVDATETARSTLQSIQPREAAEQLRAKLDAATACHVVADVPVGAFLSGGVDSAAMVGLMAGHVSYPVQTFTVGFEDQHSLLNETDAARRTAAHFGTDHHEVIVTDAEAAASFEPVVQALDQPSMDGANTFFVARSAGRTVKVALSGLGGDELFAGYPHFVRHSRAARLREKLGVFSRLLAVTRLLPNRCRHNLMLPALTPVERAETLRCKAYEDDKTHLVNPSFLYGWKPEPLQTLYEPAVRRMKDPVSQLSLVELTGYMCRTLLRDVDTMGMAHGLEIRPILLDHELAQFAFALPSRVKLQAGRSKAVFADALADLLPRSVLSRPKRGFELPLMRWLSGPLKPHAQRVLGDRNARQIFRESVLRRGMLAVESPGPRDFRWWCIVVLLSWLELSGVTV